MAVSENTYALTSLENVRRHLKIEDSQTRYDAELVAMINQVSERIEGYLGRRLKSRTYVHDGSSFDKPRLDSTMGIYLQLPNCPVTNVASLKTYPTATALTEGYAGGFVVHAHQGIIELVNGYTFWSGAKIVEITYTAGYLASPTDAQALEFGWDVAAADIELLALQRIARVWTGKERSREGIASRSEAGVTVSFVDEAWTKEEMATLMKYRRVW